MTNNPLSADMVPGSGAEICQVYCNGKIFEGWMHVSVTRSIDEAACRFQLSVTEPSETSSKLTQWQIKPGDPVQIKLGGEQAMDGYVDVRQAAYDAESHGVEIAGRSKTADAVDSAAVTKDGAPVGPYKGYTLDAICRAMLKPFGIGLKIVGDIGPAFPMVSVQYGETVFEVIERLCRLRGFHLHDDADGDAVISQIKPGGEPAAGLVEGVNIKRASATFDVSQVASDQFVVGSMPGDDKASGAEVSEQSAKATNSNVKRYRPKAIVAEHPSDKQDMKTRADREMAQIAADTAKVLLTVYGWLKADGKLWKPGDQVHVKSPMLLIDRVMAVRSIEWTQDDQGGTETNLELVVPDALFNPAPSASDDPSSDTGDGSDAQDGDGADDETTTASNWNIRSSGSAA